MKLSVNILAWNNWPILTQTLGMLKEELKDIGAEVIVVDNGSTDGIVENLWRYAVLHLRNDHNLGISKGKNQGIDASFGDYIMLLDGDIVPVPNSIRCLVKYLDDNPDCQAIGFLPNKFCQKVNHSGNCHEEYCHKLEPVIPYRGHCIYYGIYRREVFNHIRFDESFGVGYGWEDLDSYMQMEAKGIKQWAAGINSMDGKYPHAINSSINNKNCLGFEEYMRSSVKRAEIFKKKWNKVHAVSYPS